MYIDLGFRMVGLCGVASWFLLLFVARSANAGEESSNAELRPRFLPRDQLLRLPIVARDAGAGHPASSGNGTVNGTQPHAVKSSAGWSAVSGGHDRQSFYALIQAGGINFRVVLDTGSSDLWILSSACETEACNSQPRYPLSYQSPSFQSVNGNTTVFSASYADGSGVSGIVAREKVELAGLVVANQTFGLISDSNVSLSDQESGFLGLGFPRLSTISTREVNDSRPFLTNLAEQGLIDYPLFGFSLTRNLTGSLSLGAIDASVVTFPQNISWNDVAQFSPVSAESNTSGYLHWAIPLTSFGVNGTQLVPLPSQARATDNVSLALFDVGTPGFYGPYSDVSRLYNLIEGARLVDAASGQWVVPCDTNIPISLTFGSYDYILQPSDYIIGPASGSPSSCFSWPRALPPSADGLDWQIGIAFLQTVYTIFSYGINAKESPKIGLYPLGTRPVSTNTTGTLVHPSPQTMTAFTPQTTIQADLPNSLIPTPTFTTPAYAFNTSVPATIGGIVQSGLATSTYSPILAHVQATTGFNASVLPTISPSPSVTTITTNGITTTSAVSSTPLHLGVPPGWSGAGPSLTSGVGVTLVVILGVQFAWHLVFRTW
ncbi:hypothetical protein D9756_003391 [Leucocoprinus leucothites]|uniref:Peptidase A1 domain-containing protein n=1 Tax=Leucocoprinus leucothites TaxID=201217 RepID=A0A8H5G6S7_9AGAR|nr:hypothetical protein D9756_003391 [Leucoagaricus leucothites]